MRSQPTIFLLPVLLATAVVAAETRVHVTKDHTCLRYQNADSVEMACEVPAGQELVVRGPIEGSWVPVVPPDGVSVWIYSELVHKGLVVRDKAQVRSGPGLSYKVAGSLDRNTPVESRGRIGDWMKIKPPAGFSLWVSTTNISLASTNASPLELQIQPSMASGLLSALSDNTNAVIAATGTVGGASTQVQPVPDATPGSVARTPPPAALVAKLLNTPQQGRRLRCTGTLRACLPGATMAPVSARLCGPDRSGGITTFCLLLPDPQVDNLPAGTTVTIEGPSWLLTGESVPVLQVETLKLEK